MRNIYLSGLGTTYLAEEILNILLILNTHIIHGILFI